MYSFIRLKINLSKTLDIWESKLTGRQFILSNGSVFLNTDITSAHLNSTGNMAFLRDWLIIPVRNGR